jgi:hypothetical protein
MFLKNNYTFRMVGEKMPMKNNYTFRMAGHIQNGRREDADGYMYTDAWGVHRNKQNLR